MSEDLVAFLRTRLDGDEATARSAAEPEEWVELNRQPRPDWYVQYWADPDRAAVIADPESSAYPVVVTVEGMDEKDAAARVCHIARHDPARVLREVEAKRQFLARYDRVTAAGMASGIYEDVQEEYDWLLHQFALIYANHPDYDEEWTP